MDRWLIAAVVVAAVLAVWWASRHRREARHAPERVDPADFELAPGSGVSAVVFTSPYCLACRHWTEALRSSGTPYRQLDVGARPDLARRYRVRHTPLVLAVRRDTGEVAASYDAEPAPGDVSHVAALVSG
jgi:hypothetical protein